MAEYKLSIAELMEILGKKEVMTELRGESEPLDIQFGLIGPKSVAEILSRRLPNLLKERPDLAEKVDRLLEKIPGSDSAHWTKNTRLEVASLIGGLFENSDELRRETSDIIRKAMWTGSNALRREGRSSFFTRLEDKSREELTNKEYLSIEQEIFIRLKHGMRGHNESPRTAACATGLESKVNIPSVMGFGRDQSGSRKEGRNGEHSDVLGWQEFQAIIQGLEPSDFGEPWNREPQKTLFWLMQHGIQDQLFEYIYNHASELDGDIRKMLYEGMVADDTGVIPVVWRTILLRALSPMPS